MSEYEPGATILPEVVELRRLVRAYRATYEIAISTGELLTLGPMWDEIVRRYDSTPGAHFAFDGQPIRPPPIREDGQL